MEQIIVVGSLSKDLTLKIAQNPRLGETIIAQDFKASLGGKGNNQAIACARNNIATQMIGNVGCDSFGSELISNLKLNNINTKNVFVDAHVNSGLAIIDLYPDSQNSIIICPESNHCLTVDKIEKCIHDLVSSQALLIQLEIPIETVVKAIEICSKSSTLVFLNPAPAPKNIETLSDILPMVDFLIPNQSEAESLCGITVDSIESASKASLALKNAGAKNVIITLGSMGAYALTQDNIEIFQPAFKVNSIDTVAAGDAFCGTFVAQYLKSQSINHALKYACAAGSLATTKYGAVDSIAYESEIINLVNNQ